MDLNLLLEQAAKMEQELKKANEELNAALFEGKASGGLVTVTINGNGKVQEVFIAEELMNPDDREILQDMIMIAFNDASDKLEKTRNQKLSSATGGLSIPGL